MKQRTAYKDLGISSTATINPKYWDKQKEQQKKWAEEDTNKKNKAVLDNFFGKLF